MSDEIADALTAALGTAEPTAAPAATPVAEAPKVEAPAPAAPTPGGEAKSHVDDFMKSLSEDLPVIETPEEVVEHEKEELKPEATVAEEETTGPDEDGVEQPKNMSEKAAASWKVLKQSKEGYKKQAKELDTQIQAKSAEVQTLQTRVQELEQLTGKAALVPEMEEKLNRFDELEKTVSILRVEESKEYRDAILAPLDVIADAAAQIAKANGIEAHELYDVINETDPVAQRQRFKEVTAGWDDMDRHEVFGMIGNAKSIFARQNDMRANAHAAAKEQEKLASEAADKAKAATKAEYIKATDSVVQGLKDRVPFVPLRDGETAEERFAALAEKVKGVDFDGAAVNSKATAIASVFALADAVKTITTLQAQIKTLESRVADKAAVKPTIKATESKPADEGPQDYFAAVGVPPNPTLSGVFNF